MSENKKLTEDQKKQYYELLYEIQAVDFVLVELNLYLDTHPQDHKAINQYNEFAQKSMALKNKFQSMFGPLYHFGNSYSTYPWTWDSAPWPWQV
ncbi:spore coat protein CotJB [Ammoniphilus sp. YIM 78166]|uniref:spore coat protein CotJB n=1 Tax=Ammoniphilus sp. YIM 78166 TaxID=1644106 RepID=UPI00106F3AF3|nr:spore coat protein CotJB [Ammoniphilus sp. YIM 78166]